MPSPFPGMDPYLEAAAWWRGFHNKFIGQMEATLNADLPPGFGANSEERVYIISPQRSAYPDVLVKGNETASTRVSGGGTAVLEPTDTHGILIAYPERIMEPYIVIRAAENLERVITIIEVLSPANKTLGSEGRAEYLQKQHDLLHSETHLMEIDLLRGGVHTVAAPLEGLQARGHWDYLVCLHRSTQPYHFEYWFISLRESLPKVSVPLTEDVPEVELDLQAAFTRAYDAGPYTRLMDYRRDPPIPLSEADTAWVDALLKARGLRP